MVESYIPINGKKLANRWDVETKDLIYIILAHDLRVIDQYHEEIAIEDILEEFKDNKNLSNHIFRLDKVKDIETKLEVDSKIPYAEAISCEDLMTRWEMHEAEIYSIMFAHGFLVITSSV
jgi:hypothetical protein